MVAKKRQNGQGLQIVLPSPCPGWAEWADVFDIDDARWDIAWGLAEMAGLRFTQPLYGVSGDLDEGLQELLQQKLSEEDYQKAFRYISTHGEILSLAILRSVRIAVMTLRGLYRNNAGNPLGLLDGDPERLLQEALAAAGVTRDEVDAIVQEDVAGISGIGELLPELDISKAAVEGSGHGEGWRAARK